MASLQFQDLLIEDLLPQDKSLHRSCRERVSAWASQNTQPLMVLFAQFASAPEGRRRTEQQSVTYASFATLVEAAGLTKKEQVVTDTVFARAVADDPGVKPERGRLTLAEFVGGLARVGKAVCASTPSPTKFYPEAALLGGMRTLISEQLQPLLAARLGHEWPELEWPECSAGAKARRPPKQAPPSTAAPAPAPPSPPSSSPSPPSSKPKPKPKPKKPASPKPKATPAAADDVAPPLDDAPRATTTMMQRLAAASSGQPLPFGGVRAAAEGGGDEFGAWPSWRTARDDAANGRGGSGLTAGVSVFCQPLRPLAPYHGGADWSTTAEAALHTAVWSSAANVISVRPPAAQMPRGEYTEQLRVHRVLPPATGGEGPAGIVPAALGAQIDAAVPAVVAGAAVATVVRMGEGGGRAAGQPLAFFAAAKLVDAAHAAAAPPPAAPDADGGCGLSTATPRPPPPSSPPPQVTLSMCCCAAGGRVYDLLSAAVEAGIGEPVAASAATADHALLRLPLVNARHAAAAVAEGYMRRARLAALRGFAECESTVVVFLRVGRRAPQPAVVASPSPSQSRKNVASSDSVGAGRRRDAAKGRPLSAASTRSASPMPSYVQDLIQATAEGAAPSDPEGELCLVDVAEPLLPTAQVNEQLGAPTAFERALLGEAAAEERDAAAAPAMQICSCLLSVQRRRAEGGRLRSVTAAEEATAAAAADAAAATSSDGVGRWAAARGVLPPLAHVGSAVCRLLGGRLGERARVTLWLQFSESAAALPHALVLLRAAERLSVDAEYGACRPLRREVGAKAPEREPAPAVDGTPEAGASLGEKREAFAAQLAIVREERDVLLKALVEAQGALRLRLGR